MVNSTRLNDPSARHSGAGRNPAIIKTPRSGQNHDFVPPMLGIVNHLDTGLTGGQPVLSMPKGRYDTACVGWVKRSATHRGELNRSTLLNQLRHPLVQRQSLRLGGRCRRLMDAGVKAQHELAGMPFERLDSLLRANLQKHLQLSFSFVFQPGYILGIKIRAAVQSDKLAAKHLDVRVVLNDCSLSFNHHHIFHGFTPLFSSHLRISTLLRQIHPRERPEMRT